MKEGLAVSLAELSRWKNDVERLVKSAQEVDPSRFITAMYDLAARMGDDVGEALLDAYPELFDNSPALTRLNNRRVTVLENTKAQLLEGRPDRSDLVEGMLNHRSKELQDRAYEMVDRLDFRDCRRLVVVGCGAQPTTAFHFHGMTGVSEIVGLDIEPEAVNTARNLAVSLRYERVGIECCNGRAYDYSQAQIIYIANVVSPKSEVISRIADTAPEKVQIAVREPYSLGRLWAETSERSLDSRLEIVDKGPGSRNLSRNMYVARRNQTRSHAPAS